MLTETAYAKVNLALHVRRRRADGYHDIESLFAFVDGGDELSASLRHDGRLTLTIDGPLAQALGAGPDNLVLRAARELQLAHSDNSGFGADLYLTKNLPVASGIGGGSADAAAALRLLNRLWGCGLDDAALCAIGETLGSDIPACVISRSLRVEGRGEALELIELPGLAGTPILLVNPGVPLGTAPVFRGWDQQDGGTLDSSSLAAIIRDGRNDLQLAAQALVPEIGEVLKALAEQPGITLARMSGSGATCFALLDSTEAAAAAQKALAAAYPGWWLMSGTVR